MSKQYTKSEVASISSNTNNLIILHDKVYDVTSFLNEHPGGEEILIDHAGKDGSEDFDDVGHSKDAFELMKKYQVGELVESERTNRNPKQSWATGFSNKNSNQDQGLSPKVVLAALAVLVAVVYFVYL